MVSYSEYMYMYPIYYSMHLHVYSCVHNLSIMYISFKEYRYSQEYINVLLT